MLRFFEARQSLKFQCLCLSLRGQDDILKYVKRAVNRFRKEVFTNVHKVHAIVTCNLDVSIVSKLQIIISHLILKL